jgi:hypothetical protein
MKLRFAIHLSALLIGGILADARAAEILNVLVVTGGHGFEREPFFKVFKDNPEIAITAAGHQKDADAYEHPELLRQHVVVLYDMPKTITDTQKAKFLALFDRGIGLVVMHHALVSFQQWPDYERIIGGRYPEGGPGTSAGGYEHDVKVPVVVVAKDHPITAGLSDFMIHDEIYWGFRVGTDVTPLLSTTHPKSGKPLAWTRTEGQSRVVYIQLGHGPEAFENPHFRRLLAQSIRWAGQRRK